MAVMDMRCDSRISLEFASWEPHEMYLFPANVLVWLLLVKPYFYTEQFCRVLVALRIVFLACISSFPVTQYYFQIFIKTFWFI